VSRKTIALTKPITLTEGGPTITELSFRDEVVAGDLRGVKMSSLQDPPTEELLKIAGRLCAQPDVVMNRLSLADFVSVAEAVVDFLNRGLPTPTAP
jgi:hypothetical protein